MGQNFLTLKDPNVGYTGGSGHITDTHTNTKNRNGDGAATTSKGHG